jgi:hypothetical protein
MPWGAPRIGGRDDRLASTPRLVAAAGIHRYGTEERPWPCGVGEGETPGLMVGLAGIGHFYLRMYASGVPSLLALSPAEFIFRT